MPNETRNKIDELTGLLMKENPIFKEYQEAVEKNLVFRRVYMENRNGKKKITQRIK